MLTPGSTQRQTVADVWEDGEGHMWQSRQVASRIVDYLTPG